MKPTHVPRQSSGHTLVELVSAMVAGSVLLVGLGSMMLIARQIAYTPTASVQRLEASELIQELAAELRFAKLIVEQTPQSLEFVVADQNNDAAAERIRYEWSGESGQPLYRTRNGGTPAAIVDSVEQFSIALETTAETTTLTTTTDSAEALVASNPNAVTSGYRAITGTSWSAQRISAASIQAAAPAGAVSWNATRTEFVVRKGALNTGTLYVQLRSTGEPHHTPTSEVLGSVTAAESSLDANASWYSVSFPSAIRGLALHRDHALVWRAPTGETNIVARMSTNDIAATWVFESDDAGASWDYVDDKQIFYRLYGTYTSAGPTHDVTRNVGTHATVSLQTSDTSYGRVDASVPLENRPEILSAYWRADFDADPTAVDGDGDGTTDWVRSDGDPFDTDSLISGAWYADEGLETQPDNDFAKLTTVDVRCRNSSVGGNGAVTQIFADGSEGVYAPLIVRLQLQTDGTQTLTLLGKSSDVTETQLFQCTNLSDDFVRFRLTIVPDQDLVQLEINGEDQGAFTYPTYSPSNSNRYLTIFADTSNAEFDYAEVLVAE